MSIWEREGNLLYTTHVAHTRRGTPVPVNRLMVTIQWDHRYAPDDEGDALTATLHAFLSSGSPPVSPSEASAATSVADEPKDDDWKSKYLSAVAERDEAREHLRLYEDEDLKARALAEQETALMAAEAERDGLRAALEGVMADAELGNFLRERRSYSYGDRYTQPEEHGINWEWQQATPDDSWAVALQADIKKHLADTAEDEEEFGDLLPRNPVLIALAAINAKVQP
jgi:hypothetical protein